MKLEHFKPTEHVATALTCQCHRIERRCPRVLGWVFITMLKHPNKLRDLKC